MSWVTLSVGSVTRYSAPPVNSMPMLRPLDTRPKAAIARMTAETAYQTHLRPTKSIERRPE